MSQEQNKTISGSVYDTYTTDSQDYKQGRMPRVGQTVEFEDGRKYVFVQAGADIGKGLLARAQDPVGVSIAAIAAVGTYEVRVINVGAAANKYAGGTFLDPNLITYKIKSSSATATVDGVANVVILTLYDRLVYVVPNAAPTFVQPDACKGVLLGDTGKLIKGVAHVPLTNGMFGWLQYQGLGPAASYGATPGSAVSATDDGYAIDGVSGNAVLIGQFITSDGFNAGLTYWNIPGGC